ncbi:MAG: hypothetical protein NQ127_04515, partial [Candidatus Cardinium sp.]|nr:hypothetical protein [Candidatus Cardinium sp.]
MHSNSSSALVMHTVYNRLFNFALLKGEAIVFLKIYHIQPPHSFRSKLRYWIASAKCISNIGS